MLDIAEFKNYLRVDFDDDDSVIEGYLVGAEHFICLAVGKNVKPEDLQDYPQFKPAVLLLGALWYNTKMAIPQTATVKANTEEIPMGVSALIVQLEARYWEDYVAKQNESKDSNTSIPEPKDTDGGLEENHESHQDDMV